MSSPPQPASVTSFEIPSDEHEPVDCSSKCEAEPHEDKPIGGFIAAMGNFSIQYNLTSASVALSVMEMADDLGQPLYVEPLWSKHFTLAATYLGTMVGMLSMGCLADIMSIDTATLLTLALSTLGTVVPALAMGTPNVVYAVILVGRFMLGMGVGGLYPLTAARAAKGHDNKHEVAMKVSWAFFWQTPGQVTPYLVSMFLVGIIPVEYRQFEWARQLQFRLLFLLGAIPPSINFFACLRQSTKEELCKCNRPSRGLLEDMRRVPFDTKLALAICSSTWCLYDVAAYGTFIYLPTILMEMCLGGTREAGMCHQTLLVLSTEGFIVSLMSIIGVLCAIALLPQMGCKHLKCVGFLLIVSLLVLVATRADPDNDHNQRVVLFIFFCLLQGALSFGPSLVTFVEPTMYFPENVLSSFHGICSFSGKCGALLGTLAFPIVQNETSWGLSGTFWLMAVACTIATFISLVMPAEKTHSATNTLPEHPTGEAEKKMMSYNTL